MNVRSSEDSYQAKKAAKEAEKTKAWVKTVRFLEWLAQHYNRLEVYGIEHVPDKGHGGILCANHPALLDPGFIHIAVHTQKSFCV